MIRLTIISPCYNEEEILLSSSKTILNVLNDLMEKKKISEESCWLCVNDGSNDRTWEIIKDLHQHNRLIIGINLAHNVGHQNALMAGMMTAKEWSDAVITIDADLQDDTDCIEHMVDNYQDGYDVVYGVKISRKADPILKRLSAEAFYHMQEKMGISAVFNHADFRLLSKRVLNALSLFPERNLYLRGIIPMIGYSSTTVNDIISERSTGKSKYSLGKMLDLAMNGITSFSIKPLTIVTLIGILFILVSICIGIYVLYSLVVHTAVSGWASLMLSIWLVGGVNLISIGMIGLYIGKIFIEVKRRPLYIVKDIL